MKTSRDSLAARPLLLLAFVAALCSLFSAAQQTTNLTDPIVLTGADRRPALSLDGDWASIIDPYF